MVGEVDDCSEDLLGVEGGYKGALDFRHQTIMAGGEHGGKGRAHRHTEGFRHKLRYRNDFLGCVSIDSNGGSRGCSASGARRCSSLRQVRSWRR